MFPLHYFLYLHCINTELFRAEIWLQSERKPRSPLCFEGQIVSISIQYKVLFIYHMWLMWKENSKHRCMPIPLPREECCLLTGGVIWKCVRSAPRVCWISSVSCIDASTSHQQQRWWWCFCRWEVVHVVRTVSLVAIWSWAPSLHWVTACLLPQNFFPFLA